MKVKDLVKKYGSKQPKYYSELLDEKIYGYVYFKWAGAVVIRFIIRDGKAFQYFTFWSDVNEILSSRIDWF